jgi:hypothetical protein
VGGGSGNLVRLGRGGVNVVKCESNDGSLMKRSVKKYIFTFHKTVYPQKKFWRRKLSRGGGGPSPNLLPPLGAPLIPCWVKKCWVRPGHRPLYHFVDFICSC